MGHIKTNLLLVETLVVVTLSDFRKVTGTDGEESSEGRLDDVGRERRHGVEVGSKDYWSYESRSSWVNKR